jgi:hypothetical protein
MCVFNVHPFTIVDHLLYAVSDGLFLEFGIVVLAG